MAKLPIWFNGKPQWGSIDPFSGLEIVKPGWSDSPCGCCQLPLYPTCLGSCNGAPETLSGFFPPFNGWPKSPTYKFTLSGESGDCGNFWCICHTDPYTFIQDCSGGGDCFNFNIGTSYDPVDGTTSLSLSLFDGNTGTLYSGSALLGAGSCRDPTGSSAIMYSSPDDIPLGPFQIG